MHGPGALLREQGEEIARRLDAIDRAPRVLMESSEKMPLADESVHLVVTSPPYPMIEMWDGLFEAWTGRGVEDARFYDACHAALARVWDECARVLVPGGIAAINIGDATRTLADFRLYPNHVDVTQRCVAAGLTPLVPILWKKPTNKPNAFLGSGFLPPNAYVTLDCEFLLLFRKGAPRKLPPKDLLRYASEMSKAERDAWFTQVWDDVRGTAQQKDDLARRTAAYPEEVPYRLVRMFSLLGETVLDPFAGTGTTLRVAAAEGRRAVGFETEPALAGALQAIRAPEGRAVVERLGRRYPGEDRTSR